LYASIRSRKTFKSIRNRVIIGLIVCALTGTFVTLAANSAPSAGSGDIGGGGSGVSTGVVPSSAIDRPAVDRVVPADAAVNVKTQFGAKGDGVTDDTAAIQAAISAAVGLGNPKGNLYFPSGTYIISKPLEWKLPFGTWSTGADLIGQNRDRTILKLKDEAPGFGDPAAPKSMIVTASQNAAPDGGGNQAFNNFIFDLTIDVGHNNPGANGIDYMAHNRGAIRNVVLTAPTGSGNVGLSMTRKWPGPAMIEDVAIRGFSRGVIVGSWEYSITFENLRVSGQRVAGIENINNTLNIRRMVSHNIPPAIINEGAVTLVESELLGGAAGCSAIKNQNMLFLRNVGASGYAALINDRGIAKNMPANGEYSSSVPISLTGTNHSLSLPVPETPVVPNFPASEWAGLGAASTTDWADDTAALQAALNSGKPVVYLRPGQTVVSKTLEVPSTVKAIVGYEGFIHATSGQFAGTTNAPILRINGSPTDHIAISHLGFKANPGVVDFENSGMGTVALTDIHISASPIRGGNTWFLNDVEGGAGWKLTKGQHIYARQFNPEQSTTKVVNDGATFWILGVKTEGAGTVMESRNGASTEVLGGLLYPSAAVPAERAGFLSVDSKQSLTFSVSAYTATNRYDPLISTTAAGKTMVLKPPPEPDGFGSRVPLYVDGF
jgi:hypothetical protein